MPSIASNEAAMPAMADSSPSKTPASVGYADISPTTGEISRSLSVPSPENSETSVPVWGAKTLQPISPLVGAMSRSDRGGRPCTEADEAAIARNAMVCIRPALNSSPHGNPTA